MVDDGYNDVVVDVDDDDEGEERSSDFATAAAATDADATQSKGRRDIPPALSRPLATLSMDSCTALTTTILLTTNAFRPVGPTMSR